jgi:hypothetical protein
VLGLTQDDWVGGEYAEVGMEFLFCARMSFGLASNVDMEIKGRCGGHT